MNAGDRNYELSVPSGWTTKNVSYRGVNYYFLIAPQTPTDPNTSINVITEDMQQLDLKAYNKQSIKILKQSVPSSEITGEGTIVANGLQGRWYTYTMSPQGIKASMICYVFPKNVLPILLLVVHNQHTLPIIEQHLTKLLPH